jgi:hypothetical protein
VGQLRFPVNIFYLNLKQPCCRKYQTGGIAEVTVISRGEHRPKVSSSLQMYVFVALCSQAMIPVLFPSTAPQHTPEDLEDVAASQDKG